MVVGGLMIIFKKSRDTCNRDFKIELVSYFAVLCKDYKEYMANCAGLCVRAEPHSLVGSVALRT